MSADTAIHLTAAEASARLRHTLAEAEELGRGPELEHALDRIAEGLGLALQLGPGPIRAALATLLHVALPLAHRHGADGLAALSPAVVGVVTQALEAGAVPATPVMAAWAVLAADLGTLIGRVGLALTMSGESRTSMLTDSRRQAAGLDGATEGRLGVAGWVAKVVDECIR